MQNLNLKFKDYIAILLIILSILMIYFSDTIIQRISEMDNSIDESQKASAEIAKLVLSLDKISLDTSVLNASYLMNVKTLPQFPLTLSGQGIFGKFNPFLGNIQISTPQATTTQVGAVQYATQRDAGQSSVRVINVNQNTNSR